MLPKIVFVFLASPVSSVEQLAPLGDLLMRKGATLSNGWPAHASQGVPPFPSNEKEFDPPLPDFPDCAEFPRVDLIPESQLPVTVVPRLNAFSEPSGIVEPSLAPCTFQERGKNRKSKKH